MEGMSAVTHRGTKQHICLEISPVLTINLLTTQISKAYKKIDEGLSNRICEYHKAKTCLTFFFNNIS